MKEMIGGCCVCSDEQGWAENPLVYCDGKGCNVAVHQACYGIESVPLGPWYCRKCEFKGDKSTVICKLCPNEDGALKKTDTDEWAHVICALYIPEVEFGNVKTMEPIIISRLPNNRFLKTCYICEKNRDSPTELKNAGACMACQKAECPNAFHVTCGQRAGLLCEKRSKSRDNIKYTGFCSFHYKKEFRPSQFLAVPAYIPPPVKEVHGGENETARANSLLDKHRWDIPFLSSSANKLRTTKAYTNVRTSNSSPQYSSRTLTSPTKHNFASTIPDPAVSAVTDTVVPPNTPSLLFGGPSHHVTTPPPTSLVAVKEESSWSLSKFMSSHHTPATTSHVTHVTHVTATLSSMTGTTVSNNRNDTERKRSSQTTSLGPTTTTSKSSTKSDRHHDHDKKGKLVKKKSSVPTVVDESSNVVPDKSSKRSSPHPQPQIHQPHKRKKEEVLGTPPKPLFSDDDDSFGSIKNIEDAIRETTDSGPGKGLAGFGQRTSTDPWQDGTRKEATSVDNIKEIKGIKTELQEDEEDDLDNNITLSKLSKPRTTSSKKNKILKAKMISPELNLNTDTSSMVQSSLANKSNVMHVEHPTRHDKKNSDVHLTSISGRPSSAKKKEPKPSKFDTDLITTASGTTASLVTEPVIQSSNLISESLNVLPFPTAIVETQLTSVGNYLYNMAASSSAYIIPPTLKMEIGAEEESAFALSCSEDGSGSLLHANEDPLAQYDFQKLQHDVFAANFRTLLQTLPPEILNTLNAFDEVKNENQRLQNYMKTLQMEYSILKSLHASLL